MTLHGASWITTIITSQDLWPNPSSPVAAYLNVASHGDWLRHGRLDFQKWNETVVNKLYEPALEQLSVPSSNICTCQACDYLTWCNIKNTVLNISDKILTHFANISPEQFFNECIQVSYGMICETALFI